MDLEKKLQEMNEAWTEMKKANDAKIKSLEEKGFVAADIEAKIKALNETIDKQEQEMKKMQTAMNRVQTTTTTTDETKSEAMVAYEKSFKGFLKGKVSDAELREMEKKTMSSDSDQDGGILVTPEMSSEIIKKVFETSLMRSYASQQTISSSSLEILEDLDEVGSGWVGETESRGETATAKFNEVAIPVHELFAEPPVTQRLLDDASINIESWLAGKVAEKFSRDENTAFVSGNGVKKPKGILSYDSGTGFGQIQQVLSGVSGGISGDSLINLMYELKTAYMGNAKFFTKRENIKSMRLLKDSQNRYLWAPGMDGNTSGSILGHEIVEFADMPVIAANNLSIAFGDMKQAYQIVDRIGIRVLRDPYTKKGYVLFYTTKRVGGGVKNFEALKLMKITA